MNARAVPLLGLLLTFACSDPVSPPTPDAGYLIGDATVSDSGLTPIDAAPDAAVDAGLLEDAAPPDAALLDAAPRDAGLGGADADPADVPDPCSEAPALTTTATGALALVGSEGAVIDVVGTATITTIGCTDRACGAQDPCCNTCTAEVWIDRVLPLRAGACAATVGCSGDECNLVCSPPVLGIPGRYRGRLVGTSSRALELYRVLP
ncbi:MAG: hypothetical protein U1E65_14130 [Myxococcota bacterium]